MIHRSFLAAGIALAVAICSPGQARAAEVDYQRDIAPLLADRCFACHGPDASQRKGKLRLDQEEDAKRSAIIPGDADASELVKRIIATDPNDIMPPPHSQKPPLNADEVDRIRAWIDGGAPWAKHWAFTPPAPPAPPAVELGQWPRNFIDPFLLGPMEAAGLSPSPEADRETLIRRLTLDLTGLPPTLEDIDYFVQDNSDKAYEALVDRLLASPAYGEHMARTWLDGARYADTNGNQNDFHRVMWPWRDWVIRAFNDNMPFDQFTIEQIAGDLLPNATESQRVATGFNRNNRSVTEGGSIEEEWLVENLVDRVETTSTVFLGLTMGCARCHDHKYDPVTQREFFEFYAFFNSTEDRGFYEEVRGNTGPQVYLPSFEQQREMTRLDRALNRAQTELDAARKIHGGDYDVWRASLGEKASEAPGPAPAFDVPTDGAPVTITGPVGPALALDGSADSTLDLGQAVAFHRDKPFSAALWVRPESAGALFSKVDNVGKFRGLDTHVTRNGDFEVHMASDWDEKAIRVVAERALKMGQWAHVAVTYDGSGTAAGLAVYVGGLPVPVTIDKDTLTGSIETDGPLRIGQRASSAYFKGRIANLQFFDGALPAEAIAARIDATLAAASAGEIDEAQDAALREFYASKMAQRVRPQQDAVDAAQRGRNEFANNIPSVMVMQEREEPRPTYLLERGAYDAPDTSEQLYPGTPEFLPALAEGMPRNRLGLAQWLVDPENPLTARVTVNRLWQQVFGRGLVRTAEDFGVQGSPPSHPELLDALALHFVESGWDVKGFLKELVTSAAYRQSSEMKETLLAADPENRLYARAPRYRLSAETIRDNALAVSGLLAKRLGGPPAMPYQPEGLWEELAGGASQGPYILGEGEDLYRRSLYTHRKRTVPHPTLATFDAPSFEYCLARRSRTNTPLQALALLNDITYVEAARHLAQRMVTEVQGDPEARVAYGFRLATGRQPTPSEMATLRAGLDNVSAAYGRDVEAAAALVAHGNSPVPDDIPAATLAPYMTMAGVLLNLDEAITRE